MATYRMKAGNSEIYKLEGAGKGVANHKLVKTGKLASGSFNGEFVYLRMPSGFKQLIKYKDGEYLLPSEVDTRGASSYLVSMSSASGIEESVRKGYKKTTKAAKEAYDKAMAYLDKMFAKIEKKQGRKLTTEEKKAVVARMNHKEAIRRREATDAVNPYAIPRAGTIKPFVPATNPYQLEAGEIEGAMRTAPQIDDIWSNFGGDKNPYAIPRAGEIKSFARHNNPDQLRAGEILGDLGTAPEIHDISNASGAPVTLNEPFGVQAGQIYQPQRQTNPNPYQVEGGEIAGRHEVDSHEYEFSGFQGIQAGQMWDYGGTRKMNPDRLRAGEIEGSVYTMPESHEPIESTYLPATGEAAPAYEWGWSESYFGVDGYGDGNNKWGVQAGQIFDWGSGRGRNPYQVEGGEIEGSPYTAPESHSYANGGEYDRAYRYPNMLSYGYANPMWRDPLPEYGGDYPQYTDMNFSGADGYSNAKGDFWKKIGGWFKKDKVDESKVEFTEEEMEEIYKESGSKKSFSEWMQSEEGQKVSSSVATIATILLGGSTTPQTSTQEGIDDRGDAGDDDSSETTEKKILGMHPVTFGIVTVLVLGAGIVTVVLLTRKKK